ncbi:hypothetical protein FSP39_007716 [Pinctada imbricata]|uniref:Mab-21-like HhH/H2TH-like domain-containing protein n=1 Tax=Pinctada imbricata TaxID=66713 RepID=A0AA88XLG1_PINIB|nr:hypothetical protein FSP39_007716 [Pinctada imbricata]
MEQERFLSSISRCLYYATRNAVGTEDNVNVERLVRDILSCVYTDLLTNITSGVLDSPSTFARSVGTLTAKYSKPFLESIFNYIGVLTKFIKIQKIVVSGSRSEGFDFESSDFDLMLMIEKLLKMNGSDDATGSNELHFQIEDDTNDPGFVRVKVLSELTQPWTLISEYHEGGYYLSSSKLLEHFRSILKFMRVTSFLHGPCLSLELETEEDNDFAFVLKQDTWPTLAGGCIHRLAKRGWPSNNVLLEILKNGVLYVPIGFPLSPLGSIQWRLSFSIAENLLVRSMNHSQFLTYALLKLTLKEVIDADSNIKGLLCSYFLKTAVFWEIESSRRVWDPSNLLHCFWRCFRRILNWVDAGYCPNFFVPENNMFRSKIHGSNRRMLLDSMAKLYGDGFDIFQRVPSLSSIIDLSGEDPSSRDKIVPGRNTKSAIMIHLMVNLRLGELIQMGDNCLSLKRRLANQPHCEYATALYTIWQLTEVNESCLEVLSSIGLTSANKNYRKEKELIKLLKMSAPYCVRGYLYLAYHLFMRMRYEDSIRLLQKVLIKLEDPNTTYRWEFFVSDDFRTSRSFRQYKKVGGDLLIIPSRGPKTYRFVSMFELQKMPAKFDRRKQLKGLLTRRGIISVCVFTFPHVPLSFSHGIKTESENIASRPSMQP